MDEEKKELKNKQQEKKEEPLNKENTQVEKQENEMNGKKKESSNNIKKEKKKEEVENTEKSEKEKSDKKQKTEKIDKSEKEKSDKKQETEKIDKSEKEENNKKQETEKNVEVKKTKEKLEIESEKEKEFKQIKEENRKHTFPVIFGVFIICAIIIFSIIFALANINNDKILSGITINEVDISNLTLEEAIKKMEEITAAKLSEEMLLKKDEYETSINANQINAKFDIENAVNQAYNIGRAGNIVTNNYAILEVMLFKKEIELPFYYDEQTLENKIKDISSKMPDAVKQSSYYIEDENLIIVQGKDGLKIKETELKQTIINEINEINEKYDIVQIETETVKPDEIDLAKIREEIYKEPKNAYVSKNPITVHPHVNGVDFKISVEEAQKKLNENKKEYKIPLKITVPKKTIKDLGEEAFPEKIANYSTRYDATNYNRSNNLSIAAKKINGTIIMPGEVFSYNQVVGERTIEEGYKEAGAYAGGKVVQSVGGGICQVSSTLYNTALLANLEIVDRSNHAFLTGYVPASRDATVSWGSLDFKFKNTRKYPIKIESSAENGICEINIYGIKEEKEYEVVIQSKVLSDIPYTVKYIEDDSVEKGTEVVEQYGENGCTSEAYRILKLNGEVVSKTLISRDTYDPMQRIVRKGTKEKKVTKPTSKQSTENNKTIEENE